MKRIIFLLACFTLIGCLPDFKNDIEEEFHINHLVVGQVGGEIEIEYSSPEALRRYQAGFDLTRNESNKRILRNISLVEKGGMFSISISKACDNNYSSDPDALEVIVSVEDQEIYRKSTAFYFWDDGNDCEMRAFADIGINQKLHANDLVIIQIIDNLKKVRDVFELTKKQTADEGLPQTVLREIES